MMSLGLGLGLPFGGGAPSSPYPAGVIAAGLQSVFDHRTDTGPTSSITTRTSINGTPAGWSSDTFSSMLFYEPVGGATLSRYAFDNGQIAGRGTFSLTDALLNNPGSTYVESTCHQVGSLAAEAATYSRVNVDGTGMRYYSGTPGVDQHLGNVALVQVATGSTFVANHSKFSGAPIVNVKGFDTILNHCYVGTFLNAPYPGTGASDQSHGESIFMDGGTWGIRNTIVDCSDLNTDPSSLYTSAIIFLQTNGANLTVDFTSSIIRGTAHQGSSGQLAPIQVTCKTGHTINITITGCAIEKGSLSGVQGYLQVGLQEDANSIHYIDGGGNYDLVTGAPIVLTYQ